MPPVSSLMVFSAAALALLLVPGPSVFYIVTRSVDQGRVAGLVSVLGIHTGTLVHLAAAVVGLSAIIVASSIAFTTIKYIGAAYLIYIGIRRLLSKDESEVRAQSTSRSLARVYWQGFLVNLLNPKTALFFLAFLPQFVERGGEPVALQTTILGLLFIGIGMLSDSTYALVASGARSRILASPAVARRREAITGTIYIGLGVTAALAGEPSGS
jgi:threonine/homoserine/homoserine lactone efflux protein